MSDPRDNVLDKLDALLKKHAANEPEIPVLTDLVEAPEVDLEAIPVLTEEVVTNATAEIELDLVPDLEPTAWTAPEQAPAAPAPQAAPKVAPEAKQAAPAKPAQPTPVDSAQYRIEIPANAPYITLSEAPTKVEPPAATTTPPSAPIASPPPMVPATQTAATHLDEASLQRIASLVEADLSRQLQESLRQALSTELQGMLHVSLDKVLSSLLDQHMMMIEETVRTTVANEIQKQLAQLRTPPNETH